MDQETRNTEPAKSIAALVCEYYETLRSHGLPPDIVKELTINFGKNLDAQVLKHSLK